MMAEETYYYHKINYPCTNEAIPAVIRGLDLKKKDVMISIGGSGDIPFAIAPYVKKVYAVDYEESQIEFMKEQVRYLRDGDFDGFYRTDFIEARRNKQKWFAGGLGVSMDNAIQRKKYFSRRLNGVVGSLDKIDIVHEDIASFMKEVFFDYDKFYASNAFDKMECYFPNSREAKLSVIDGLDHLSVNGLFYVSRNTDNGFGCLPLCFIEDKDNTSSAREAEKKLNSEWNWRPEIYRKRK